MKLTRQRKVSHHKGYDIVAEWRKGHIKRHDYLQNELYYMFTNNKDFMTMDYMCETEDNVDGLIESVKGIIDEVIECPPDYYDCNIWEYESEEYDGDIMNYDLNSINSLVMQEYQ